MFIDLYDSQYSDLIALVKLFLSPMQRMSGLSCLMSLMSLSILEAVCFCTLRVMAYFLILW